MIKVAISTPNQNTGLVLRQLMHHQPGFQFLGEPNSLESIKKLRADVVLVEGRNDEAIEFCERILIQTPRTKVVLLTDSSENDHVNRAIGAGITGVILKRHLSTDFVKAINAVAKGHCFLSAEIADAVVTFYRNMPAMW